MKIKLCLIPTLLILAITLAGCTAQQPLTSSVTTSSSTVPSTSTQPQIAVPAAVSGLETTLESIYSRVNLSVVLINVILPPSISDMGGAALGSGFVWDTQGDIVTNNHVVDGASSMTVTFSDGTVVNASLVGADADSDLAVIKVNPVAYNFNPLVLRTPPRFR